MSSIKLFDDDLENIEAHLRVYKNKNLKNYRIEISKQIVLNKELLDYICKNVPNDVIYVNHSDNNIELFDEEETKVLVENVNSLRKDFNKNIEFNNGYSVEKALEASRKINKWVKKINSVKPDGTELSPFEKYLCAYQYVAEFEYKEGGKYDCRDLIPVLTGDKIVCVGFASILKEVCNRLGIPCAKQNIKWQDEDGTMHYHTNNVVVIKDDKYKINGVYYADACWDSYSKKRKTSFLVFSCMKYSDVEKLFPHFTFVTGDNEIVTSIYNDEYNDIKISNYYEIKKIRNEALEYLKQNKEFYLETFDDIVSDHLWDDKLKLKNIDTDTPKLAHAIQKLCNEMYRDILIFDHSRKETIDCLNYVLSGMYSCGFSKEDTYGFLMKIAKKTEPNEDLVTEFITNNQEVNRKLMIKLCESDDKSAKIVSTYKSKKKKSTLVDEDMLYDALKNIGTFYGLSEEDSRIYARNKIDNSADIASTADMFMKEGVENPIINLAKSMRIPSQRTDKQKADKEKENK